MGEQTGLYKFVALDTNKIIYIGKSNKNIKNRIEEHIRGKGLDEKFTAYKDNFKVFVAFLPNSVETDIMERALINKYKPVLNGTDNHEGISGLITVKEPVWIEYNKAFPKSSALKRTSKDPHENDICICKLFGRGYYLDDGYSIKEHGRRIYKKFFDTKDEALEYIKYAIYLCDNYSTYDSEHHSYVVPQNSNSHYISFWDEKTNWLGPCLRIDNGKSQLFMSFIASISGKGGVLKEIAFHQPTIDICKLILNE